MKLHGKRLLLIISDGVYFDQLDSTKKRFEAEYAEVFITSPYPFLAIRTATEEGIGPDILADFPIEMANQEQFDGLIIPDGTLSVDLLRKDVRVQELIQAFHQKKLPIFASGESVQILQESGILAPNIFVNDSADIGYMVDNAVAMILDGVSAYSVVKE